MTTADILITNGRVIDCVQGIDEVRNVAMRGGLLMDAENVENATQVIDAAGCIVTPGLIDFHAHIALPGSDLAVDATANCFPNGVTTVVDPGTTGTANYEAFRAISSFWKVRTRAFLHIAAEGLATTRHHEDQNPKYWDVPKMIRFIREYGDHLIGFKVRISKGLVEDATPLIEAVKVADRAGCIIACHTTNPPVPMDELVTHFRPGDVFAHIFHGTGNTILDGNGTLRKGMADAQKRGVIFDVANGNMHFSFKVAQTALAAGFVPDIISTDLGVRTSFIQNRRVFSLPFVMSKFLMLGMGVADIVKRVTQTPARLIGQEKELGSLADGTCADVAIHRIIDKPQVFADTNDNTMEGRQLFKTEMTIRDGVAVYRQIDF